MPEITDPDTIRFLEALAPQGASPSSSPTEITDPDTIKFLEASQHTASSPVTTNMFGQPLGGFPSQQALDQLAAANRASFVAGARAPVDAGAAMLAHGLTAIAPQSMQPWAQQQLSNVNQANTAAQQQYQTATQGGAVGTPGMYTAGNIASTLPTLGPLGSLGAEALGGKMLGQAASGAGVGAASGALTPTVPTSSNGSDYWGKVATNTLLGAGLGLVPPAVLGGANQAGDLLRAGVTPTVGQTAGGMINQLETTLSKLPLIGAPIAAARQRAFDSFGRAAINEALSPIGQSLDASTPMGREAIAEMQGKVSGAYAQLLPNLNVTVDQPFVNDLTQLNQMAQLLPPDRAQQFTNFMQSQLLNKLSPAGTIGGQTFKDVESTIGQEANNYLHSSSADERKYGSAVLQLQANLRDLLARSNPDQAGQLAANNLAWANMKRVQRAASYVGANEGSFTPTQLLGAVKAQSPESQFAAGGGLMQPLAEAGKSVLGNPSGGLEHAIGAGAGLGAGLVEAVRDPGMLKYALPGAAATYGLYSPWAQWLLSRGLAARPPAPYAAAAGVPAVLPLLPGTGP